MRPLPDRLRTSGVQASSSSPRPRPAPADAHASSSRSASSRGAPTPTSSDVASRRGSSPGPMVVLGAREPFAAGTAEHLHLRAPALRGEPLTGEDLAQRVEVVLGDGRELYPQRRPRRPFQQGDLVEDRDRPGPDPSLSDRVAVVQHDVAEAVAALGERDVVDASPSGVQPGDPHRLRVVADAVEKQLGLVEAWVGVQPDDAGPEASVQRVVTGTDVQAERRPGSSCQRPLAERGRGNAEVPGLGALPRVVEQLERTQVGVAAGRPVPVPLRAQAPVVPAPRHLGKLQGDRVEKPLLGRRVAGLRGRGVLALQRLKPSAARSPEHLRPRYDSRCPCSGCRSCCRATPAGRTCGRPRAPSSG